MNCLVTVNVYMFSYNNFSWCSFMAEESRVPTTRWTWANVNGNIICSDKECKITVNLPKLRRENIAFEVTKETFCLKGSKEGDVPLDYFGCWILSNPVDPKKAKATFKDYILTVTVPLEKPYGVTRVPIEQLNTKAAKSFPSFTFIFLINIRKCWR